jgi:hypothetical protein
MVSTSVTSVGEKARLQCDHSKEKADRLGGPGIAEKRVKRQMPAQSKHTTLWGLCLLVLNTPT